MICITHTGKIGDLAYVMPICSWIYKKYNEKIIFVFPDKYPFIKQIESLLRLQVFTEDIRYIVGMEVNYFKNMGGQPYVFNPNDHLNNLNCSTYFNIGFRCEPNKYMSEFYAEEHNLDVDYDFVLNLDLPFNEKSEDITCSDLMGEFFPFYKQPNINEDFLNNLRVFACAKERHLHFSSLAKWLSLTGIPFYIYALKKSTRTGDYTSVEINDFNLFYKNAPVLDVLGLDSNNKIISQYNRFFLK